MRCVLLTRGLNKGEGHRYTRERAVRFDIYREVNIPLYWNRSFPAHETPRTVLPEHRRTRVRCGRVQLACL
jgi:hypothetical protein